MTELKPNVEQAVAFLQYLDPVGYHAIVYVDPAKNAWKARVFEPHKFPDIKKFLARVMPGNNVYYHLHEPAKSSLDSTTKLRDDQVSKLRALPVDIDVSRTTEFMAERLRLKTVVDGLIVDSAPSMVVDTGGGYQAIFKFDRKIDIDPVALETFKKIGGAARRELHGDIIYDASRILRLPGGINTPTAKKAVQGRGVMPVGIYDKSGASCSLDDLKQTFPGYATEVVKVYSLEDAKYRIAPNVELDTEQNVARAILRLKDCSSDAGYAASVGMFQEMGDIGLSPDKAVEVIDEHWNPTAAYPWDDLGEMRAKVVSLFNSRERPLGWDVTRDDLAVSGEDAYGDNKPSKEFIEEKAANEEVKAEKKILAAKIKSGELLRKFSDFANEYRPLLYVIEGIVVSAGQYTITARTGHGKTVFLSSAAIAVAAGRSDILGVEAPPGLVIYFTFENPDDFRMKIMAAVKSHKADLSLLDENLMIADARLKPEDIQKLLRTLKRDISLIVIDTFQAAFDGDDFNDNNAVLKFAQRLRPMTQDRGFPAMLIATHPVKNALQDNLLPYGGGALLNEVDGNLCLWKDERTNVTTLHWQGKFRGREFSPIQFAISSSVSPDILDAKGVEVPLPVLKLVTDDMADEAERKGVSRSVEVLQAMMADKAGSQRSWGLATGLAHAQVGRELAKLQKDKLVSKTLGGWSITVKGEKEAVAVSGALDASGVFGAVDDETY